jgi:hypothetical protein
LSDVKQKFFHGYICSCIINTVYNNTINITLLFIVAFYYNAQHPQLPRTRRTTSSRSPLYEWLACRRDLYQTTQNTRNRQTSLPPVRFETTISAGERLQTYALDRAANGTGLLLYIIFNYSKRNFFPYTSYSEFFQKSCPSWDNARRATDTI